MRSFFALTAAFLAGGAFASPIMVTEYQTAVVTVTAEAKAADVYVTEAAPVVTRKGKWREYKPAPVQDETVVVTVTSSPDYEAPAPPPKYSAPAPAPAPSPATTEKPPAPSPTKAPSNPGPASGSFAEKVLAKHNAIRALHGADPLVWDETLAAKAKEVSSTCVFEHSGSGYGENLAAGTGTCDDPTKPITSWHKEEADQPGAATSASHYSQLVWKGTTKLGCAIVDCPTLASVGWSGKSYMLTCEYDPAGNVGGGYGNNVGAATHSHSESDW